MFLSRLNFACVTSRPGCDLLSSSLLLFWEMCCCFVPMWRGRCIFFLSFLFKSFPKEATNRFSRAQRGCMESRTQQLLPLFCMWKHAPVEDWYGAGRWLQRVLTLVFHVSTGQTKRTPPGAIRGSFPRVEPVGEVSVGCNLQADR